MRPFSTAGTIPQAQKTQYGQAKFNVNGIKYNRGLGYGHTVSQALNNSLLDITPNALWDNPGARRGKKQLGRGQGSGKGKTAGRGHKGRYARAGGTINRGFEGGQSQMKLRFPKRGMRSGRFNNGVVLEQINLGKIAYFIEKGVLDPSEPITFKHLLETGILTKIKQGVKILGAGSSRLQRLGKPIHIECSDATERAVEAINETGGKVTMTYRTPLLLRNYLKPHKFPEWQTLKSPMPSPKKLRKLEKIKDKGIEVNYAPAPWFTDNKDKLIEEKEQKQQRIDSAANAEFLPTLPAPRDPGISKDKPKVQRKQLFKTTKYAL